MKQHQIHINVDIYQDRSELSPADADLLEKASEAIGDAYAPYSKFRVAAAARLADGTLVAGTNQENASYPAGICAERVLLSAISALYPRMVIDSVAVTYLNESGDSTEPISPCGICRQSLLEYEQRNGRPMRLILGGNTGKVLILANAASLLPLGFTSAALG